MTKSEQVIAKIIEILELAMPTTEITRSRVNPFDEESVSDKTVISIEPVSNEANENTVGIIDWTLALEFNFYRKSSEPEKEMDTEIGTFFNSLLNNRELEGLAMNVFPTGMSYDRFQGEKDIGEIKINMNVLYRTTQTNLSA